jgi:hypothetical protein
MPQDRSTERNKKYEGQHSGENKRILVKKRKKEAGSKAKFI